MDDLADAVLHLMQKVDAPDLYETGISHLNIGTGKDITIAELAELISKIIGFAGKIEYNTSKPDGTPQKLLDVSKLNKLGWKHKNKLKDGISKTYNWFINTQN